MATSIGDALSMRHPTCMGNVRGIVDLKGSIPIFQMNQIL